MAPAWVYAWRRGTIHFLDWYLPVAAPLFWAVLAGMGVGHQSLSHLVELPIVVVAVSMIYSVRVFVLDRRGASLSATAAATAMAVPLLIRLLMPFLPE